MNLERDRVGAVLLGDDAQVSTGMHAYGTGQVLSVPVGPQLCGRVIDPVGRPLDGKGRIHAEKFRPIEAPAPSILSRKGVSRAMETGLLAIDSMVPIGRGQRELIIGDRETGKTSIAIDAILNQAGKNMRCFYVAIGQKASSVARIVATLTEAGAMDYTTIICATASDPATMQYIAPYCGCAMAEEVMYQGGDALIVYDDLSKHAVAYRAMSLLLKRPPGREAYPGDVFYLHSRLLERAAQLSDECGGGSMTALPIVETLAGDISAYIPTNVISITDGQIFLDTELFREGVRPAVNSGLSVSRVGGAAQRKAIRSVSGELRLNLARYRELEVFSQFTSDLDATTRASLQRGAMLMQILKQKNNHPYPMPVQAAILYLCTQGLVPSEMGAAFEERFVPNLEEYCGSALEEIGRTGELTPAAKAGLSAAISAWMQKEELSS